MKIPRIVLAFFLLLAISGVVFAATDLDEDLKNVYNNAKDRAEQINFDIKTETQKYYDNKNKITELEEKIKPIKNQRATLENQLGLFDEQVSLTSTKIANIQILINQKRLEVAKLTETIERATIEMGDEKELVDEFIQQMYKEEKKYYPDLKETPGLTQLLLSDDSVSKSLQQIEFLDTMGALVRQVFHRLEQANNIFTEQKTEFEAKTEALNILKSLLEREQSTLLAQREGRAQLFAETKGKESEYQKLLEESKRQEGESLIAIANLRENQANIEEKLEDFEKNNNISSERKKSILKDILNNSGNSNNIEAYDINKVINDINLTTPFIWPISPDRGISAYFHDADYKNYFGVAHQAIDIRTPQGTPIYAPASGYVDKVADNGMGYSYIILAHKDGLSTVYGHVSEMNVKEGQLIQMGSIIGKSGATPGTKGAGVMTTGPHLHFEVHKDGKAVNPLDYLPKELLPEKYRR